jgi:hypothetical protein
MRIQSWQGAEQKEIGGQLSFWGAERRAEAGRENGQMMMSDHPSFGICMLPEELSLCPVNFRWMRDPLTDDQK